MSDDDDDVDNVDLFQEPAGFYQDDKEPTSTTFALKDGRNIQLRLIGHSPLWGHLLWNAGQVITSFLEDHANDFIKDKRVLELGAGAGLPSLAAAALGARTVVMTDYPEPDLILNLQHNIDHCGLDLADVNIFSAGYLWGQPVGDLKSYLKSESDEEFDLVILADILFNHSEHSKLIATLAQTMGKKSSALVFFTPYRPWLLEKDMAFFDLARHEGFVVTKLLEHVMEKVMFADDPGDELLRRTVFGYQLTWAHP